MRNSCSAATLILENSDIRTQDPQRPHAEALAIGSTGRILAVGDRKELAGLGTTATQRLDLGGKLCIPGFMDSHFHFYQWAMGRSQLCLDRAGSFDHCMRMIRERAASLAQGEWIQGQGFNESDWPENRMPLRDDLDAVAPHNPVLIWRCDLHLGVANSLALRLAGVHDTTAPPAGGVIDRDASGRLTGVLRDNAANLVKRSVPLPSMEQLVPIFQEGQQALHALGITALHDLRLTDVQQESALTWGAWQYLRENDKLLLRCWSSIPGECRALAQQLGLRTGMGDDFLRVGHVKYFFDGGMGARTAWMLEPYADTGGYGMCAHEPEALFEEMRRCHNSGLAVMIHAIGDRASRELITLFERLLSEAGSGPFSRPSVPHRMEHAQVIRPKDIARLARLNIPVSMMPANMLLDINMIDQCAGDAAQYAYPFRSMMEAGAPVLFSSDCPVCDPDPLIAIQGAVTRQRRDGTPANGWHPEQRVGVEAAVRAYTSLPAAAYGRQNVFGSLRPGLRADCIVLDRNIFTSAPQSIADAKVMLTIFNGKIVFSR